MSEHLTRDDLLRLWQQQLSPDARLRALQHLRDCRACAALLDGEPRVDAEAASIRAILAASEERHLDVDTELHPYIDGRLEGAEREIVESHLDDCALCRDDVETLRALRVERPPRARIWPWVAAAMLALAIAIAAFVALRNDAPRVVDVPQPPPATPRRVSPPPEPIAYANADWTQAVDAALESGSLPAPRHPVPHSPDVLRGGEPAAASSLEPAGVAVDTTRPRLSWQGVPDAEYVVAIFAGDEAIARSNPLRALRWTPSRDLQRGVTYTWQVEMLSGGERRILPEPPAPPAMFRVISREEHAELASARARHPEDHLLLAVLAARAGLQREAEAALQKLREREPRDPRLQRLLAKPPR